jgi:hypothetical protein
MEPGFVPQAGRKPSPAWFSPPQPLKYPSIHKEPFSMADIVVSDKEEIDFKYNLT